MFSLRLPPRGKKFDPILKSQPSEPNLIKVAAMVRPPRLSPPNPQLIQRFLSSVLSERGPPPCVYINPTRDMVIT